MLLVAEVPIEPTVGQARCRHHIGETRLPDPGAPMRFAAAATIASRVCAASSFDFLKG